MKPNLAIEVAIKAHQPDQVIKGYSPFWLILLILREVGIILDVS